jgi:hypothetical protein
MNINQHEAEGSDTLIRDDQDAEASLVWEGDWCYAALLTLMDD